MEDYMTPRERWLAVLRRRKPDRIPMDYWGTPEVTEKLMNYLKCGSLRDLYERLHIDAVITVSPKYMGPPIPDDSDIYMAAATGTLIMDQAFTGNAYIIRLPSIRAYMKSRRTMCGLP